MTKLKTSSICALVLALSGCVKTPQDNKPIKRVDVPEGGVTFYFDERFSEQEPFIGIEYGDSHRDGTLDFVKIADSTGVIAHFYLTDSTNIGNLRRDTTSVEDYDLFAVYGNSPLGKKLKADFEAVKEVYNNQPITR